MYIENKEIVADKGKYIHRLGDDNYFGRCTLLNGETLESFEEVSEIPPMPEPTEYDYGEEVNRLIRERYSESAEFAILRQKDEKPEDYKAYYAYCEECKVRAKQMNVEQLN